jgi:hypothetical protein
VSTSVGSRTTPLEPNRFCRTFVSALADTHAVTRQSSAECFVKNCRIFDITISMGVTGEPIVEAVPRRVNDLIALAVKEVRRGGGD